MAPTPRSTCTAAPIHDVDGRLAAALDISALHSPEPKQSQWMALQLARACAQRIELANMMASFRNDIVIRFSRSPSSSTSTRNLPSPSAQTAVSSA